MTLFWRNYFHHVAGPIKCSQHNSHSIKEKKESLNEPIFSIVTENKTLQILHIQAHKGDVHSTATQTLLVTRKKQKNKNSIQKCEHVYINKSSGPTHNLLQSTNNRPIQASARGPHTSRGFAI